jgi:aspartyl-tRNA synthetase
MSEQPSLETTYRTHACGQIRAELAGQAVTVVGWVSSQRDHGGLVFINLRDRWGELQVVVDPGGPVEGLEVARAARLEDVLQVAGAVRRRPEGAVNAQMPTGETELVAARVNLLSKTATPPFVVGEEASAAEETGLRYRYLDLRRPPLQRNLVLRHRAAQSTRRYFDERGFLEIETPFLIRSTPEGARDYLVPSRLHHGRFYALPQSPQQYKQLLMMSGFDRYVQIVRCFRDEDLRADRQPEFTQVDVEMAFVDEPDVLEVSETYLVTLLRDVLGIEVETPFPRFTLPEALDRFGSDKPDLRYGLEIADLSGVLAGCEFKIFRSVLEQGGTVRGLAAPGAGSPTRKRIDELTAVAQAAGAKGVVPLSVTAEGLDGPAAKLLSSEEQQGILARLETRPGDLVLLVADTRPVALAALGALRVDLARRLDLAKPGIFRFAWVRAFPLVERDAESGRMQAVHHPFTSPADLEAFRALVAGIPPGRSAADQPEAWQQQALSLTARAYDVVLNGYEIGGGSIRIHRPEDQADMFRLLGLSEEQAREKFGFFIEALRYGTPPHGGIAFGFDRIAMILAGAVSLREVIAFPKTTAAVSLMDGSPGPVDPDQLRELGLGILPSGGNKEPAPE